jgi:phosphohistidine phosphatase
MKSLLLVRHAKSSWDSPSQQDFDRPLNDRGDRDAPMMANRLLDRKIEIDLFVTSTAVRAKATAKYFIKAFGAKKDRVIDLPDLYHASASVFYNVIKQLDDKYNTAAIFSHNPGITEMVNTLGVAKLDNMPTCGVFGVRADVESWADFKDAPKHFWFFDYPKLQS